MAAIGLVGLCLWIIFKESDPSMWLAVVYLIAWFAYYWLAAWRVAPQP